MGSVQQCFSWELVVAASIIWHRLQRGVTFVLQDGWLCMAWTLLTLSHWWASRRGYKRHTFPQATGAKMRRKSTGLLQCDSTFQFIYLIKLCVRYWNIYSEKTLLQKKKKKKKSYPQDIEFAQATAEIMQSIETDEKCPTSPLQRWWYSSLTDPHCSVSVLMSMPHLKLTQCGVREVRIIFIFSECEFSKTDYQIFLYPYRPYTQENYDSF